MVLESSGYGICLHPTPLILLGYGVREQRLWCKRVTFMVLESNGYGSYLNPTHLIQLGYGVREQRLWC
jgi:hypothetical protein